jgi:hypothetical protein
VQGFFYRLLQLFEVLIFPIFLQQHLFIPKGIVIECIIRKIPFGKFAYGIIYGAIGIVVWLKNIGFYQLPFKNLLGLGQ